MKTLELKHWQNYLDTELKCQIQVDGIDRIENLKGIEITEKGYVLLFNEFGEWEPKEVYPYLYSLDWLTKEIEHNGEKFVPIEIFKKMSCLDEIENEYTWIFENPELKLWNKRGDIFELPYKFIQLLFEWHIAVDIPEHLYIDKSTIK